MNKYPDPMAGRCTTRVWSSGDMDPCGAKAVVADRCLQHRNAEIKACQEEIRELEQRIAENKARIHALLGEDIRLDDSGDLQTARI